MLLTGAGRPREPLDAIRHRVEKLDPVKYLSSSYYERFLAFIEQALIEAGTLSQDEIEAKIRQFIADPVLPMPRREDPESAERIASAVRTGNPVTRRIRRKPRFAAGEKIVTRNLNPHGHTRLPRYARGKRGVIVAHHGAHVFPDTNAHGLGENPQHLYTVRIAARELWGDSAEPNESVLIDLWESYVEKNTAGVKSRPSKNIPAAKKTVAKTPTRAAKGQARASSKRSLVKPLRSVSRVAPGGGGKSKRGRATAANARGSARGRGSRKTMRMSR
jgi:nitrile hydratase